MLLLRKGQDILAPMFCFVQSASVLSLPVQLTFVYTVST